MKKFLFLDDESWWGGRVCDGIKQPFDAASVFRADLNDNGYNQIAPLFLSNKGRFLWSDAPFILSAANGEVFCEGDAHIELSDGHQTLRGAFLAARQRFFPPPGAIPAPLLFRRPQYNTWIELMYDQEETAILTYARRLIQEGYPPGVLMIDDTWQEDYGVWNFHPGRFRDPKGMISQLREMGFEVMLWTCPFVSPDSANFRQLRAQGALVLADNGQPYLSRWWNGVSAVLDLTIPAGREWYSEQLQYLMDTYGVDGFKFDAGDLPFYPRDVHAQCEAFNRFGSTFPLNEYRAAWKGADLPIAQRLADRTHAWDRAGLASVLPNLIVQGLLGYPFVCPDMIGGGQYESFLGDGFRIDPELIVRYAQAAALCPMMQFSVAPWRILDRKHAALCREAAELHARFGEEILGLAKSCALTGEPMLRTLEYQFPGNDYAQVTDEFLLGDSILVAPVLTKGQIERSVIIPPGQWRDDAGCEYIGPQNVIMKAPLDRLIWLRQMSSSPARHLR